ncbi:hypothetical protein N7448_002848 [Penicillium atrosanguineum]|uniref:Uncharacterized protein n=1 Tax=Penicillium atrosanguineum TaxID=1132637 RepID=A0A9W9L715_9EURO|nr:hypothetical protein N7526_008653 [Penicillium atrosanguineum]KAJ5139440.1 hypothetical protein N7448_002848 [Penicillium atrosanguineum]KAJ5314879.1 hypothetical protein N7476_005186 [Penicillium atrosanguineum]
MVTTKYAIAALFVTAGTILRTSGKVNTIADTYFEDPKAQAELIKVEKTLYDAENKTIAIMWKQATTNAEVCYEAHKKTQPYLGTASVARDLISVIDAFVEDGMLRYWGFSYGTTLGATVASMFLDRIDKLVMDGENPYEYYHAAADF